MGGCHSSSSRHGATRGKAKRVASTDDEMSNEEALAGEKTPIATIRRRNTLGQNNGATEMPAAGLAFSLEFVGCVQLQPSRASGRGGSSSAHSRLPLLFLRVNALDVPVPWLACAGNNAILNSIAIFSLRLKSDKKSLLNVGLLLCMFTFRYTLHSYWPLTMSKVVFFPAEGLLDLAILDFDHQWRRILLELKLSTFSSPFKNRASRAV